MDLAQMAGWLAAAAAIIAMLQKSDLRLKQGLIIHTVLYGIHFALLGLPTAVVSCVIALARITLSIYTRSLLCSCRKPSRHLSEIHVTPLLRSERFCLSASLIFLRFLQYCTS